MKSKKLSACMVLMCFGILFTALSASGSVNHEVKKGDTLGKIAGQYLQYSDAYTLDEFIENIRKTNNIGAKGLSIGQILAIPVTRTEPVKAASIKKSKDFIARGAYANEWTAGSKGIFTLCDRLKKAGGNTVVFDAKEVKGIPTYKSSIPKTYPQIPSNQYSIADVNKLVDYLHRNGMHVVSRVCMFRDFHNSVNNPRWRFDKEWVNPASREVQEYNLAVIRELIGFGVDEIQVDYFRYPADGKTESGIPGKARSDVLAEFAGRIHELTRSKGILLSLDMFGIVNWQKPEDIGTLGQDVRKFKSKFDIISPMLYPSHFPANFSGVKNPADEPYLFVSSGVKRMKALVGDEVTIRPWIQAFPLHVRIGYNAKYVRTQIKASDDMGGMGWLFWSPGNHYEEAYAAMEGLNSREKASAVKAGQAGK